MSSAATASADGLKTIIRKIEDAYSGRNWEHIVFDTSITLDRQSVQFWRDHPFERIVKFLNMGLYFRDTYLKLVKTEEEFLFYNFAENLLRSVLPYAYVQQEIFKLGHHTHINNVVPVVLLDAYPFIFHVLLLYFFKNTGVPPMNDECIHAYYPQIIQSQEVIERVTQIVSAIEADNNDEGVQAALDNFISFTDSPNLLPPIPKERIIFLALNQPSTRRENFTVQWGPGENNKVTPYQEGEYQPQANNLLLFRRVQHVQETRTREIQRMEEENLRKFRNGDFRNHFQSNFIMADSLYREELEHRKNILATVNAVLRVNDKPEWNLIEFASGDEEYGGWMCPICHNKYFPWQMTKYFTCGYAGVEEEKQFPHRQCITCTANFLGATGGRRETRKCATCRETHMILNSEKCQPLEFYSSSP